MRLILAAALLLQTGCESGVAPPPRPVNVTDICGALMANGDRAAHAWGDDPRWKPLFKIIDMKGWEPVPPNVVRTKPRMPQRSHLHRCGPDLAEAANIRFSHDRKLALIDYDNTYTYENEWGIKTVEGSTSQCVMRLRGARWRVLGCVLGMTI